VVEVPRDVAFDRANVAPQGAARKRSEARSSRVA
jgi:hypothetical protein